MAGNSPNVFSELIWGNLKGPKFNLEVGRRINPYWELNVVFNKYIIKSGSGTDTDYAADNRQEAFYEQEFLSNKGNIENYQLVAKYNVQSRNAIKIKPYLGINFFEQKLNILDPQYSLKSVSSNSTYKSRWKGAVFGIEAIYQFHKMTFAINTLAGYYNYEARAGWNSNQAFNPLLSFKQNANGYKFSVNLKSEFTVAKDCNILLALEKQYGTTFSGIDEAYLSNGSVLKTKFNGANFRSLGIKTGIIFTF